MSVSGYLVCPSRRLMLGLGKRLRGSDGAVVGFALRDQVTSDDVEISRALWQFLVDTAGEELVVKFSDADDFDEIADYCEISRWADDEGDITLTEYLQSGERRHLPPSHRPGSGRP